MTHYSVKEVVDALKDAIKNTVFVPKTMLNVHQYANVWVVRMKRYI